MEYYAIIMAGGGGTRFWPLSRKEMPKQLLNITGNDILINETIGRIKDVIPEKSMYIVTNIEQKDVLIKSLTHQIPMSNILAEPLFRGTAPCILLAVLKLLKLNPDGVVFIFPSDHYISNASEFQRILRRAANIAEKEDKIVTIGIKPTFPSSGYGYIRCATENDHQDYYDVLCFIEKPDRESAKRLLEEGNSLWNSGIFICKASKLLEDFKRYLPRLYHAMVPFTEAFGTDIEQGTIREIYGKIQSISIDVGIIERSDDIVVIPGEFGWNDIGSWDALGAIFPTDEMGNIVKADTVKIDTSNCIIYGDGKLIATIGIKNMIVVNTDDALLICPKDRAQDVREIVNQLASQGRHDLI